MSEWHKISDKPPEFPCECTFIPAYPDMPWQVALHTNGINIGCGYTHWRKWEPPEPEKSECEKAWIDWSESKEKIRCGYSAPDIWKAACEWCAKLAEKRSTLCASVEASCELERFSNRIHPCGKP